jgi:hypothetical protein
LENALADANQLVTDEPHPLLDEDLLAIKDPLELEGEQNVPLSFSNRDAETEEPSDAFASL